MSKRKRTVVSANEESVSGISTGWYVSQNKMFVRNYESCDRFIEAMKKMNQSVFSIDVEAFSLTEVKAINKQKGKKP